MVTGVYDPETSGASLQCRQLIATLRSDVEFEVLTTSADPSLPRSSVVDGVTVTRVWVDPSRPATKLGALAAMSRAFLDSARRVDVVHLHGFSQKTILLITLSKLMRKRTVLKLTSFGHDDAVTMKRRGGVGYAAYKRVDRAIAVSPRLHDAWGEAGLDAGRVTLIPNGVDTQRFRPADPEAQRGLKRKLGLADDLPVVLFVGFFSHEKRPDVLYRAWADLWSAGLHSTLVLVGATRSQYYEVDPAMAQSMRADASRRHLSDHLVFDERASDIADYFRAADVFALPTTREGLPNVLLESMASAVPPVITRLPGITDWIVEDGVTGRLVPTADAADFAEALRHVLSDAAGRRAMGAAARAHVERHFAPAATAAHTLRLYQTVIAA